MRREDKNRKDSSLLLNIRGWRRLAGVRISRGELLKRPRPDAGCRANVEEEEEMSTLSQYSTYGAAPFNASFFFFCSAQPANLSN